MTTVTFIKTPIETLSGEEQDAIFRLSRSQGVFIQDINGELFQVLDLTEGAPMRYIDILRFKDRKHIDWKATEEVVVAHYKAEFPAMRASEMALTIPSEMRLVHKFVKKWRVSQLYDAQQEIKSRNEQENT